MAGVVELRVLGPLEVRCGNAALPLGGRKQQVVLALLAVNAGRAVSLDELVDEVWPDGPPASAVANVRGYAANIRRLLQSSIADGEDRLVRKGTGYLLRVSPDETDLLRFSARVASGRDALRRGEVSAAAAAFAEALACWRGSVLAGLPRGPLLAAQSTAIEEERAAVVEQLAEAYLILADPGRSAALLREHVQKNPLRERAYGLLMRSLYQGGDVAGAVAIYAQARSALAEELGVEPGRELRDLHRSILNRDGSLDHGEAPQRAAVPPVVPAQLPAGLAAFVGREDSLKQLDSLLAGDAPPAAVVISAIAGTAGIGKTALAVRWAHSVADRFPDGQLYVNLRGFDPGGSAMSPAEAVRGFLDALAVPPQRVPASFDAQVGLYRSLLAGRRMLVVLDNARDADQVRPLLPGSPGCLVLVTSRNQLGGLVAAEGASPLTLDLLSTVEAWDLLAARLGKDRVTAEPAAVDDIIAGCARLPLVLAIAAARCALLPGFPLAAVADELRDARSALDLVSGDDTATDVRSVFSWSYRALSEPAARLFRLLGLHCGPDIGLGAVASLAGAPVQEVQRLLSEMARANLVVEHLPGRFTFHDLLRAYARELADRVDIEQHRRAAIHRALDHYLHAACTAALLLFPHRDRIELAAARPGVVAERLTDPDQGMPWFATEHKVLLAAVRWASELGFYAHAWQLCWALSDFLDRQGHWHEWLAMQRIALDAGRRLGDRTIQAHVHRGLGRSCLRLDLREEAEAHLKHALRLLQEAGDRNLLGRTHLSLAQLCEQQGRYRDSLDHSQRAAELLDGAGERAAQVRAVSAVGWYLALLGEFPHALDQCRIALAAQRELGDRYGQAETSHSLGYIYHHLGDQLRAEECYQRALDLCREVGDRYHETVVLTHLCDAQAAAGRPADAARSLMLALTILVDLDHADADKIRAKLHQLTAVRDGP